MAARPSILLASCGGTIASTPSTGAAGVTPTLTADDLLAQVPALAQVGEFEARTITTIPSADITLDEVVGLVRDLSAWADSLGDRSGGIVVTHGTDTLEETAFALDLLWTSDVPVVVTGAMRNPSLPGADGPANLLAAAATAADPNARGLGVLVVLNDEIHLASTVRKSHTSSVATFVSSPFGPVGYLAEAQPRVVLRPAQRHHVAVPTAACSSTPVGLLTSGMSDDGRLLAAVVPAGYRGLVIEGVGGGHLPSVVAASEQLRDVVDVIPVVLTSRTGSGELLHSTYRFAGSEIALAERGLISAGRLDGPKARVLLTLALAGGQDRASLVELFAEVGGYEGR